MLRRGYSFTPISFSDFDDLTAEKFEYCPFYYFDRFLNYIPRIDRTKMSIKDVKEDAVLSFKRIIATYPKIPTENKYNRFFIVHLKNSVVYTFKTKDANLGRNRNSPLCDGLEWGYNGNTCKIVATDKAIDKLEVGESKILRKQFAVIKEEGKTYYRSMHFDKKYIEVQKRYSQP